MGRPREHNEATGRALLDAGEELLSTEGPAGLSVRAVALHADVSTRAVYSLFGSKAGLLQALAARGYELLAERVAAVEPTDDPASDLIAAGLEGFRPFALSRPALFRLTFERIPAEVDATAVNEASLASYEALANWILRAQVAGVIDDRPEEEIAFAFHSCCLGLATSELSREPPPIGSGFWQRVHGVDGVHLWRGALTALIRGLAPR